MKAVLTRVFERAEEKVEIKANSIEEWIYQAEKLVEDEKRKVGGGMKVQNKKEDIMRRLGKISN